MQQKPGPRASIRQSIQAKREEINLTTVSLTKSSYLQEGQTLPLILEPALEGVNLVNWAENNRELISKELAVHGTILFRNFGIDSPTKFEAFARTIGIELFEEYGDLPRDQPGAKVYHSTPYPHDKSILFHNESSHMHRWPMKIWFYCVKAAEEGGATPIVDCRKVYQTLDPKIIALLSEKKLLYVRNFINGLDVSWQQFFQTDNRQRVEEYCTKVGIEYEWKENDGLATRQICQAVTRHPLTGEMVFFNQIFLHHISCLDPAVRESMETMFSAKDLPRNVSYGDGSPIEDAVVEEIQRVYNQLAVRFQWQPGDIAMVDNMMVAHSRDPFAGTRKILVAMAEMITNKDIQEA
ncbi:MAG TPA: TauD/TfdA family dioxygenase [Ktedonobacteraceae bacterium]|nr:TauD/TfdA family dioxygenase [Ktedonobacteraceae bacterium]